MKKTFCCSASRASYEDYYKKQNGGEIPIFYGSRMQRGHGIGSILGGLFRKALPFLKRGGINLGKQLLSSGIDVANDMIDGKKFKDAAIDRLPEGINQFANRMGFNRQSGSGVRTSRKRKAAVGQGKKTPAKKTPAKKRVKKDFLVL